MRPAKDDRSASALSASKNECAVLMERVQQVIAPSPLTAALRGLIESSAPAIVIDALAAFKQRRSSIREPITWLIEAVQWKPAAAIDRGAERRHQMNELPEFDRLMQSCRQAAQQQNWQFVQQRISWLRNEGWYEMAERLQAELN